MAEKIEGALSWNDEIENDGARFILLTPGDYEYKVVDFKPEKYKGSAKIPAGVNKAVLTLQIPSPEGTATVQTDLILFQSLEWKLSAFFRSIGQKKHGEKLKPNWKTVIGSTGKVKIGNRTFVGKDGKNHDANEVVEFLDPDYVIKPISQQPKPKAAELDDFLGVPEDASEDDPFK